MTGALRRAAGASATPIKPAQHIEGLASSITNEASRLSCPAAPNQRLKLRQLTGVPSSAQGFDELDAGGEFASGDVGGGALVCKLRGLGGDHFQVGRHAAFVAIGRDLQGAAGGVDGASGNCGFVFEDKTVGAVPAYVSPGAQRLLNQPWMGMMTMSRAHWANGDRVALVTYSTRNSVGFTGTYGFGSDKLAWFELDTATDAARARVAHARAN